MGRRGLTGPDNAGTVLAMSKAALQIDAALLAEAKGAGVNAEDVAEAAIRAAITKLDTSVQDAKAAKWAKDSGEAMAAYNQRVQAQRDRDT